MIRIKRVYEPAAKSDGKRFLVDRIWPRGVKKDSLQMANWLKEAAPSTQLRKWFGHDPARWEEFRKRYRSELEEQPAQWEPLQEAAVAGDVTLLFSAHDTKHNNAIVLRDFLKNGSKSDHGRKNS